MAKAPTKWEHSTKDLLNLHVEMDHYAPSKS